MKAPGKIIAYTLLKDNQMPEINFIFTLTYLIIYLNLFIIFYTKKIPIFMVIFIF